MFISLKSTRAIASLTSPRTYLCPSRAIPQLLVVHRQLLTRTQEAVADHKQQPPSHVCVPNRKLSRLHLLKASYCRQRATVGTKGTHFSRHLTSQYGQSFKPTGVQQHLAPAWLLPSRAFSTASRLSAAGDSTMSQEPAQHEFKTLLLTRSSKYVASIELNRPKAKNAFSLESGRELMEMLSMLEQDPTVRCVVLSGQGPDFTSGVDIKSFMNIYGQLQDTEDVARRAKLIHGFVEKFQAPFKALHSFGKPIICVHHGLALGLAMELAACCDIRYCSRDAKLAIREVLIGIAADVGSLQLMPRLASNQSLLHELAYTGRFMTPDEALQLGFVSRVLDTKEAAMAAALELATTISRRSPVAVQGTKRNLQFSRDKPFLVGLEYNAIWNAAMLQGGDVVKAIGGIMSKQNEDEVEYDDF